MTRYLDRFNVFGMLVQSFVQDGITVRGNNCVLIPIRPSFGLKSRRETVILQFHLHRDGADNIRSLQSNSMI